MPGNKPDEQILPFQEEKSMIWGSPDINVSSRAEAEALFEQQSETAKRMQNNPIQRTAIRGTPRTISKPHSGAIGRPKTTGRGASSGSTGASTVKRAVAGKTLPSSHAAKSAVKKAPVKKSVGIVDIVQKRLAMKDPKVSYAKQLFSELNHRFYTGTCTSEAAKCFGLEANQKYIISEHPDCKTSYCTVFTPEHWEFRNLLKDRKKDGGRYYATDINFLQFQKIVEKYPEVKFKRPNAISHFSVNNHETLKAMASTNRSRHDDPTKYRALNKDDKRKFYVTDNGKHLSNLADMLDAHKVGLSRGGPDDDIYRVDLKNK